MQEADGYSQMEKVTLRLRQMLMEGEFTPGDRLLEVQLSRRLGVSRTPIRLALEVLAKDGLLRGEPRRGFTVCEITVDEIADAFDVRGALEALACSRLAERGLTTATRITLEECLEDGARLLAKGHFDESDTRAWTAMNARFHTELVQASGNKALAQALDRNNKLPLVDAGAIAFNAGNLAQAFENMREAHSEHTALVDALQKKQSSRAEALVREHIYRGRENLRRELQRIGVRRGMLQVPGLRLVVG